MIRFLLNYSEFMKYIKENNISVKKIEEELGYSQKSIFNNWKKSNKIPEKALISIKMYIDIRNYESTINKLLTKEKNNCVNLTNNAYRIAKEKSIKTNITVEEYISSLIISNV